MNSLAYELPLVFVSGILGSAHCIGMCGAISAMMNMGTTSKRSAMVRQLLWSFGRIFTYAFLGLACAVAGRLLTTSALLTSQTTAVNLQAGFAILAGLLLVIQGLAATGWLSKKVSGGKPCLTASIFGSFLRGGSATGVFVAGILTGFLPCGLVYSFLALAAATASAWKGPILMLAFGLGTVPVMLLTGIGLTTASLQLRQRLMKIAGACVLITGMLTIGRGIVFAARSPQQSPQEACPFCQAAEEKSETGDPQSSQTSPPKQL